MYMLPIILAVLITLIQCDVVTIDQQFFSNYFNDIDTTNWLITGNTVPTSHLEYNCAGTLLFGGYNIFTGDPTNPINVTRKFFNLLPHWSIRIRATLYKIDSWNNQNLFVTVDNVTQAIFTWNSSLTGSDICGATTPVIDSLNPSYSDGPVSLDVNVSHSSSTLAISFTTTLNGWLQSWGMRNFQLDIDYCDRSCASCDGPGQYRCLTCDPAITNLLSVSNASYVLCSCSPTYAQSLITNCAATPCMICSTTCTAGYYLSSSTTCTNCNGGCATCVGATNDNINCLTCANGYYSAVTVGPCLACDPSCATCNGLSSISCLSCSGTLFYLASNNSCNSVCPSIYFTSQSQNLCILCNPSCLSCAGPTSSYCLSCNTGTYLYNYQCVSACTSPMFSNTGNNTCVYTCPAGYYVLSSNSTCYACSVNCSYCANSTFCLQCASGSFMISNLCVTTCPINYYANTVLNTCDQCYQNCSTCTGISYKQCLTCLSGYYFNNSCYTTCPAYTYATGSNCASCDSTCLSCIGPANTNCLTCPYNYLYHINLSSCILSCPSYNAVDNTNNLCWDCLVGQVSYLGTCQDCHLSCVTCSGITFQQCLSCSTTRYLQSGECLCVQGLNETQNSQCQQLNQLYLPVLSFIIINSLLCLFLQCVFKYKTNILLMIGFLQQISYSFYICVQFQFQTFRILQLIYNAHPSFLINNTKFVNYHTNSRYAVNNKTGWFVYDAGFSLLIMLAISTAYALVFCIKKITKKCQFINRITKLTITKIKPYMFTTFFCLIIMELSLAFTLNLLNFSTTTVLDNCSIVLMIFTILALVISFFWKIIDENGISHFALIYNNQLVYQQTDQKDKATSFKAFVPLMCRFIIPIVLPIYDGRPLLQSSLYSLIFVGKLMFLFFFEYKRKIYKWTLIGSTLIQIIYGIAIILISFGYYQLSLLLQIIILMAVMTYLVLTILQAVINYKLYPHVFRYVYLHMKAEFQDQEQFNK